MIATAPAAVKHKAPEIERKITSSTKAPEITRIQASRTTFLMEKREPFSGGTGACISVVVFLVQQLFLPRGGEGYPE